MTSQPITEPTPAQYNATSSSPSSNSQQTPIIDLMKGAVFNKGYEGTSLHDRMIKVPLVAQLQASNVSAETLLLNLVNDESIYAKIESYMAIHETFKQVLAPDLFRAPPLRKDIAFFMDNLKLARPQITPAAKNFLDFIDKTAQENPRLLLGIIYVLYSKIFEGRITCANTINWLRQRIENWEQVPENNKGVSFWSFRNISSLQNAPQIKLEFINGIHVFERDLNPEVLRRLPEITRKAFICLLESMESVTETPLREVKNITFTQDDVLPNRTKVARIFLLVIVFAVLIKAVGSKIHDS